MWFSTWAEHVKYTYGITIDIAHSLIRRQMDCSHFLAPKATSRRASQLEYGLVDTAWTIGPVGLPHRSRGSGASVGTHHYASWFSQHGLRWDALLPLLYEEVS
uniref:Uncharacterized protein n=1 Tax=Sphaerodactylus townsendi TaxID=933632 RepID=A0ACB8FD41_9SAUR